MKPGLDTIAGTSEALGSPHLKMGRVVHVAGTNGKGATCAMIDSCLRAAGFTCARYTSPHLVALNERFLVNGRLADDATLDAAAARVAAVAPEDLTFFEALTACGFLVFSEANVEWTVLETGLGGRLDATNICESSLAVITRIGLDHCDWLGDTIEKIAAEKGGIIKPGVPVVLGENVPAVRNVVSGIARAKNAPFYYAPDLASEEDIPPEFSLSGAFNRENAITAIAALKVLSRTPGAAFPLARSLEGMRNVQWPGRFHVIGRFIVDGAHNPPAARALASAIAEMFPGERFSLIAGFCADKDVGATLRILAPLAERAFAVRTANPRAMHPRELARLMENADIAAEERAGLGDAINAAAAFPERVLICGSLFLAGEAVLALLAYPWPDLTPSLSESVLKV